MEFRFSNPNELEKIIKDQIDLSAGNMLCLQGEMGAGKTTFTQILGGLLGITNQINSPTFIIHNEYLIPNKPELTNPRTLHHLDLYRIESKSELIELKLQEAFKTYDIVAIEWADKFKPEILRTIEKAGMNALWIQIQNVTENLRIINFEKII